MRQRTELALPLGNAGFRKPSNGCYCPCATCGSTCGTRAAPAVLRFPSSAGKEFSASTCRKDGSKPPVFTASRRAQSNAAAPALAWTSRPHLLAVQTGPSHPSVRQVDAPSRTPPRQPSPGPLSASVAVSRWSRFRDLFATTVKRSGDLTISPNGRPRTTN